MTNFRISRRSLLAGSAALTAFSLVKGTSAYAQNSKDVIIGTWGGDYERLLQKIIAPELQKENLSMTTLVGNAAGRRTQLIAGMRRHTANMDVACLSDIDTALVGQRGAFIELDESVIPNKKNVFPQFKTAYSIPHIYSALVIVYNPDVVSKPTSYKDLWKDEYKGKIGFSDILYLFMTQAASQAFGGTKTNYEAGQKALMDLKGAAKVYPSNEAIINAFHSGEIAVTLMWKARAIMWKKEGLNVAFSVPDEGSTPVLFEAAITKNAANPDGAKALLNLMLKPELQILFASEMGYLPTVNNAMLPDELQKTLGFSDEERQNFYIPDMNYLTSFSPQCLTWWNQDFKG